MATNANGAGNVFRLAGLKNVHGRKKVLPGAQFLQALEDNAAPQEYEGISNQPEMNSPQIDAQGEVPAQAFDVRANEVMNPSQESQENVFTKLGGALAEQVNNENVTPQTPPIETQQVDLDEGIPPVSDSQQVAAEEGGGWSGFLSKFGRAAKQAFTPSSEAQKRIPEMAKPAELSPNFAKNFPEIAQTLPQFAPEMAQQKVLDHLEVQKAMENPFQIAAYGATDEFAKHPELVQEFQQYTGIDFTPEMKDQTDQYEKVISDMEKGIDEPLGQYTEQEERIKQRILNNEATDQDKFYIGLALAMPLIIGGIFGKEAALGSLGGAAKGIADIYGRRAENIAEDERLLSEIGKQKGILGSKKGELQIERLKIPVEVRKMLPEDEYKDLKGMNFVTFKDPATGEVIATGPELKPGFVADLSYANTPKEREKMRDEAAKLSQDKASLERSNAATRKVIEAAMQIKNPGLAGKMIALALSEDKQGSLKKLYKQKAPEIFVDGRWQNSAVYLDSQLELIKDAYRRNENMKAYTNTIAQHIGSMAENPQYSGLKSEDLIDQMISLRDRGQNFFVERAKGQGFLPYPFISEFGEENRKLYGKLNKGKEEEKKVPLKHYLSTTE